MADSRQGDPVVLERVLAAPRPGPNVHGIAWSPDGRQLVAGYQNGYVARWPGEGPMVELDRSADGSIIAAVAWSPADDLIAAGGDDEAVRIWAQHATPLDVWGAREQVSAVGWSPAGDLAVATWNGSVMLRSGPGGTGPRRTIWTSSVGIRCLAWSPDGDRIVFGSGNQLIVLGGIVDGAADVLVLRSRGSKIWDVTWSPAGWIAAATDEDSIEIWDPGAVPAGPRSRFGRRRTPPEVPPLRQLEARSGSVGGVALRPSDQLLAAVGNDEFSLWRTDTWAPVWISGELHLRGGVFGIAFSPTEPRLAVRGAEGSIEIYRIDVAALLGRPAVASAMYTTAKIVLVGESGVGKTGLGHRLATGEYTEHSSTHGQQFWPLSQLHHKREDGTECEAVLWDLAGQPDYRLTHSLFLDDADLALLVFDPSDGKDPLKAVDFWRSSLRAARDECACILVGGRADRGSLVLTADEVAGYCRRHEIAGGYVETSARSGEGLDRLLDTVRRLIPWDDMVPTVTTLTFKRIKERVLEVKAEQIDEVVVSPGRLRDLLDDGDDHSAGEGEVLAAARHLSHHGFVAVLRRPSGDDVVLLRPELLNNLAASYVLEARRNERGLGAVDERLLRPGGYDFRELEGLSTADQELLLEAVTMLFLRHNVCFREKLGAESFLIFPELIKLRKRDADDVELLEGTAYRVKGSVENVYAALVVLLGYTNIFRRTQQWVDEARYEMRDGQVCGLRQLDDQDGEVELVLLFGPDVTDAQRLTFVGLVEDILGSRRVTVERYSPLFCGECGEQQERNAVIRRRRRGRDVLRCEECGAAIVLPSTAGTSRLAGEDRVVVAEQRRIAAGRTELESATTRIKGFARGHEVPTCFVSYAWGDREHERWVEDVLVADLRKAEVDVVLDRRDNAAVGSSIGRFVERVDDVGWVVVVGNEDYLAKHQNRVSSAGSVVAAEMDLVNRRLLGTEERKLTVLPVLRSGTAETALPVLLRGRNWADMRDDEGYFGAVFDLILTLHGIGFDDEAVVDLRRRVRQDPDGR